MSFESNKLQNKHKGRNILSIIFLIMFVITLAFTYAVKNIDVTSEGLNNTSIGFTKFNKDVFETFADLKVRDYAYEISKYVGYIPFLFVVFFALVGLCSLLKNKSLKKVDAGIYFLLIAYLLMGIVYFIFEKKIINYRPVYEDDGTLEASFPSSHTLFSVVLCGTTIILNNRLVKKGIVLKNKVFTRILNIVIAIIAILIIGARLLSCVHWATDIIAGALYGFTVLVFYCLLLSYIKE